MTANMAAHMIVHVECYSMTLGGQSKALSARHASKQHFVFAVNIKQVVRQVSEAALEIYCTKIK